jgi:hypothetical protein
MEIPPIPSVVTELKEQLIAVPKPGAPPTGAPQITPVPLFVEDRAYILPSTITKGRMLDTFA